MTIIAKAHSLLICAAGVYAALLGILCLEPIQRSLIYLHHIKWAAEFHHPESYGYLPSKVLPFELHTSDNITLGAWQVLPQSVYDAYVKKNGLPESGGPLPQEVFDNVLRSEKYPTVLYLHGNAATRAASNRVNVGRYMSAQDNNFIIFDYRGFADSTPVSPTEAGLLVDARTGWDYLAVSHKIPADRIVVMGQSLGTGVAVGMVSKLAEEGVIPRALILVAPFASIPSLLENYRFFDVLPVLAPLKSFPGALDKFLRKVLWTQFDSLSRIKLIRSPILILHALNDPTIPSHQSESLFRHLSSSASEASIKPQRIGGWGTVSRFERKGEGEGYWGDVVRAEAVRGGHNEIGTSESSLRLCEELIRGGYRKSM